MTEYRQHTESTVASTGNKPPALIPLLNGMSPCAPNVANQTGLAQYSLLNNSGYGTYPTPAMRSDVLPAPWNGNPQMHQYGTTNPTGSSMMSMGWYPPGWMGFPSPYLRNLYYCMGNSHTTPTPQGENPVPNDQQPPTQTSELSDFLDNCFAEGGDGGDFRKMKKSRRDTLGRWHEGDESKYGEAKEETHENGSQDTLTHSSSSQPPSIPQFMAHMPSFPQPPPQSPYLLAPLNPLKNPTPPPSLSQVMQNIVIALPPGMSYGPSASPASILPPPSGMMMPPTGVNPYMMPSIMSAPATPPSPPENGKEDPQTQWEELTLPVDMIDQWIDNIAKQYNVSFVKSGGKVMGAHADRKTLDLRPDYQNNINRKGRNKRELLWTQKYVCSFAGKPRSSSNEDEKKKRRREKSSKKCGCKGTIIVSVYADNKMKAVVRVNNDHTAHQALCPVV